MPSLTALATKASWQVLGNDHPVLRTELVHTLEKNFIFFRRPLTALVVIDDWWHLTLRWTTSDELELELLDRVELIVRVVLLEVVPALEAPDLRLVGHVLAQAMPRTLAVLRDKSAQFLILVFSPVDLDGRRFARSSADAFRLLLGHLVFRN